MLEALLGHPAYKEGGHVIIGAIAHGEALVRRSVILIFIRMKMISTNVGVMTNYVEEISVTRFAYETSEYFKDNVDESFNEHRIDH